MDTATFSAIKKAFSQERSVFYYFRDRYALMLLARFVGDGKRVDEVRRSQFGKLLQKPSVKALIARSGSRNLTGDVFESSWPAQPEAYVLTLGEWGDAEDWDRESFQMTRSGTNLVLQLNFSMKHDRECLKRRPSP